MESYCINYVRDPLIKPKVAKPQKSATAYMFSPIRRCGRHYDFPGSPVKGVERCIGPMDTRDPPWAISNIRYPATLVVLSSRIGRSENRVLDEGSS
jgi:hypothetical protein